MEHIQDAFQLYEQSFLSERSLWYQKRPGRRAKAAPVLIEEAAPGLEAVLQAQQLLRSEYGRGAVAAYVEQWLGGAEEAYSSDLDLSNDKAYIMSLLAVLTGGDAGAKHTVTELEGSYSEHGYSIPQLRIARKEEELERDGLIGVEWVKGRPVLSAVILNLAQVDRCYQITGRVHPRQQAQLVAEMIQAALARAETPWIAAWRDEMCVKARSAYSVPNFCKKDTVFLSELLSALVQYDALCGQPVTMRTFSSRCYHDSKYFERSIRDSFLTIARSYHRELAEACERGDMGVRDQLACLGIYARPELYELSGRCVLTTEMGSIHVDAVWPFGIALPSTAVDSIRSMDLSGIRRVVFIENKTNYDEFLLSELDADTLAVYHGGFLSPQKRKLFAKLADAIPRQAQVFFWADIDLGGFQMFSRLQVLFPRLLPLRMSGEDVAVHWKNGLSRSEEYLEQLKQALERREYPLFGDAIQKILEYGVTIEQEIFLGDP